MILISLTLFATLSDNLNNLAYSRNIPILLSLH
jgi:hypothetical protein